MGAGRQKDEILRPGFNVACNLQPVQSREQLNN